MIFEYLTSEEFRATKDETFTDFTINETKRKQMMYLDEQNRIMSQ